MSTTPITTVVADPAKPWKALAAAVVAFILVAVRDYYAGHDEIGWEGLLVSVGSGLLSFLITYSVPNPLKEKS